MIRLLLHSQDKMLQLLLGPTLGGDFQLTAEARNDLVREMVLNRKCDVLIMDLAGGEPATQVAFYAELRASRVPVIVMMDDESRETAAELVELGVHNCFRKPPARPELRMAVRRAFDYGNLRKDLAHIHNQLQQTVSGCDQMIRASARLRHVYDLIHRVARLESSVPITGESGTGVFEEAGSIRIKRHFNWVSC